MAEKFIWTAVARKNIAASWELLDSAFPGKDAFTKKTWAKGRIPVVPYPASGITDIQFQVGERHPAGLILDVALIPKRGAAGIFRLGLRSRGNGAHQRWLVDYWNPASSASSPLPGN